MIEPEQWQKNLFTERDELKKKHERLMVFIESEKFSTLPYGQRSLLLRQSRAMHDYQLVLSERILALPRGVNYQ